MSYLNVTLRNDYLRISLPEGRLDRSQMDSMQSAFLELFDSTPSFGVVVVDLPNVGRLAPDLVEMLQMWQRVAAAMGRRFRMNGLSHLVSQIQEPTAVESAPRLSINTRRVRQAPAFV